MIDRPDWDKGGGEVAPAMPTPDQVIHEVATQSQPSEATRRAFADDAPVAPARYTSDGKAVTIRHDWNHAPVEVKSKSFSGLPDWSRNEQGQFISTSQADVREAWSREGGFELNRDRVLAAEQSILSLSENPAVLQASIATLPEAVQLKAANIMRLSAGYKDGGAGKWLQFESSLTPSELQTFMEFWRKLPQSDRDGIELAMSK
jgi:hypothetical protein